jgi:carbonic anhydrase
MDFRVMSETRRWMLDQGLLGDCDVVSLAGASKEIADGNNEAMDIMLKQINTSCRLHQACKVYLVHHSDCGAYKSSYRFASDEEEKEKQLEDMEKAKQIIREKFPHVDVVKVWAQLQDSKGEKIEFSEVE